MPKATAKPRLSLTKTQLQAGAGADLLSLCQSLTADGRLDGSEITELRRWLRQNRDSDLPSIAFLCELVERITADGRVTRDEHDELYRAIEVVLPPEARRAAKGRRAVIEARRQAQARAAAAEQRSKDRAAREAERAEEERREEALVDDFDFLVRGVQYEGRARVVEREVEDGCPVRLVREPRNSHDPNAVLIQVASGRAIGYVPREDAEDLAPYLDGGHPYRAWVKKVLRGRGVPVPVVVIEVFEQGFQLVAGDPFVLPPAPPPSKPWWKFW